MGLTDLKGLCVHPISHFTYTSLSGIDTTLDAADELICNLYRAPRSGTISKIGVYLYYYPSTPTLTLDASIEKVRDAIGTPVYTTVSERDLWGTNTYGQLSISGGSPGTGFKWISLNSGASVTEGDLFAAVVRVSSYTSGSVKIQHSMDGIPPIASAQCYFATYTGSWYGVSRPGTTAVEWSDGIYPLPNCVMPVDGYYAWYRTNNPNRRGAKFRFPFPCKLWGIQAEIDPDSADVGIYLYDSDEYTVLSSVTVDYDKRANTYHKGFLIPFGGIELAANTWYRWALYSTSDSNYTRLSLWTGTDDGSYKHLDVLDMGTDCILTTFNGTPTSGSHTWTDDDTKRPICYFLIEQLHDGTGGGGGGGGLPILRPSIVR